MIDISVIITCFNSEGTILETLYSVSNQTYDNWECIIVDDFSTDRTLSIVEDFIRKDPNKGTKFKLIKNSKNLGHPKVLNQGVYSSKGKYIIFLDSDDLLKDTCLERRIMSFDENLDFMVFPSNERFFKKVGDIKVKPHIIDESKVLKNFITHKLPTSWNIMGPIWKKEALLKIGCFDEKYIRLVDVELSTRALIYGLKYKIVYGESDHFYRITSSNVLVRNKRNRFFNASFTYIEEILLFTKRYAPEKQKEVKKYMFLFFLSVFSMLLVSKQFDRDDIMSFIDCGRKQQLIKHKGWNIFFRNKILNITRLPVIRGGIWRMVHFYIYKLI